MRIRPALPLLAALTLGAALAQACGGDEFTNNGASGGGGSGGSGGSAGSAGAAGSPASGSGGEAGAQAGSGGEAGSGKPTEDTKDLCSDSKDNDGDGYIDCDDFDCCSLVDCKTTAPGSSCITKEPENTPERCSDDKDNDGDNYYDCEDKDCCGVIDCAVTEPESFCGKGGGQSGAGGNAGSSGSAGTSGSGGKAGSGGSAGKGGSSQGGASGSAGSPAGGSAGSPAGGSAGSAQAGQGGSGGSAGSAQAGSGGSAGGVSNCSTGEHPCIGPIDNGQCFQDSDTTHCGSQCQSCTTSEPNSVPVCVNNACGLQCNNGYQQFKGHCREFGGWFVHTTVPTICEGSGNELFGGSCACSPGFSTYDSSNPAVLPVSFCASSNGAAGAWGGLFARSPDKNSCYLNNPMSGSCSCAAQWDGYADTEIPLKNTVAGDYNMYLCLNPTQGTIRKAFARFDNKDTKHINNHGNCFFDTTDQGCSCDSTQLALKIPVTAPASEFTTPQNATVTLCVDK